MKNLFFYLIIFALIGCQSQSLRTDSNASIEARIPAGIQTCASFFNNVKISNIDLVRPIFSGILQEETPSLEQYHRVPFESDGDDAFTFVKRIGSEESGYSYYFKGSAKKPGAGTFTDLAEQINAVPQWTKKLGFKAPNRQIVLSDLHRLNENILSLRETEPNNAPSVLAATYASANAIADKYLVQLWAQGYFIVETKGYSFFKHDLFAHGVYGYLLFPKFYIDRLIRAAQIIGETDGRAAERLYKDFAKLLDDLSNEISNGIYHANSKDFKTSPLDERLYSEIPEIIKDFQKKLQEIKNSHRSKAQQLQAIKDETTLSEEELTFFVSEILRKIK